MSRERNTRVRLDGLLLEEQLTIVHEIVLSQLIGSAGDLRILHKLREPRRAVREVAVLGGLAFWLGYREILVPDRRAREVMSRMAREIDGMNAQGDIVGNDPAAEHDAMWTFVGLLADWPAAAEVHDHRWGERYAEHEACRAVAAIFPDDPPDGPGGQESG